MTGRITHFGKEIAKRATAVLMVLAVLFSLSSCDIVSSIQKRFDTHSEDISKQELARLVTNAIKSSDNVADSYSSIPEKQLDGMSYTVFLQYCEILRGMSERHGKITAFKFLTDEETSGFFAQADKKSASDALSMTSYTGLTMVELMYENDDDKDNPADLRSLIKTALTLSQTIMLQSPLRLMITSRTISR